MMLKKYVSTFVMLAMMAVMMPLAASTASGQTRYYGNRTTRNQVTYKRPNVYQRHRKAFNLGIGTGAGAIIGGLIGGGKGAAIGALAGLGGGAIVTAKQKPKNYVRRTYVRRY